MLTRLDGAMGTQLQARGLRSGEIPEDWNIDRPNDIAAIHRAYAGAGAEIVYANTFGANRLKYRGRYDLRDIVAAGVRLARESGARVALDVGPTGRLLKSAGDLAFEEAVATFAEQVRIGVEAGADLIVIETMGDLYELKAAVVAAKENSSLPIYATVALNADGLLLTGGSVECVANLLEGLRVDAYGLNCGLGPEAMLPFVERLAKVSTHPIIVKPNAGLPQIVGGRTVFTIAPREFSRSVERLVDAGASIIGGCCGTTPQHVAALGDIVSPKCERPPVEARTQVSSGVAVVDITPRQGIVIGERINPTGKKRLKEAYLNGDVALVLREAVEQTDAGAKILDVNCGLPGLDEAATLEATVEAVQSVVTVPLQIDTANPIALERALRRVNGKALVNSVNGSQESMAAVFPLVRKYGGVVVGLCLDERGIPDTVDGRLAIARRILAEGAKFGLEKKDFVFDALTLAVSAEPKAALVTLETVRRLTDELSVNTILGLSNVSFGLPGRAALNRAMFKLAREAGLSAAIANPGALAGEVDSAAIDVLLARDENCARWLALAAAAAKSPAAAETLKSSATGELSLAIRRGLRDDARRLAEAELATALGAMAVIEESIVPALEEVGRGFEAGRVFLPQLLMAADAAGEAFAVVRRAIARQAQDAQSSRRKRPIVLATVRGDVHDIGKNIVRALLENYGYDVIDLGRDVESETIVKTARENNAFLVGLSALMTTTVGAMAETCRLIRASGLDCRTVVGGAVVTEDFAASIGADYYAKDAMRTVRIAAATAICH